MEIWQHEAAKKITRFIGKFYKTIKIECTGSILTPEKLDAYSDVDMEVYLSNENTVDMAAFINVLYKQFETIFGYEIHRHDKKDLLRICFMNGHKYDLSFIYPNAKTHEPGEESFEIKTEYVVNQFWYAASQVLVKLGRGDYLVAAHLALELCQLIIVLQMLERDYVKNTNIHRRGDRENVPILHSVHRLKQPGGLPEKNSPGDITDILFTAAGQMDETASSMNPSYARRTAKLEALYTGFGLSATGEPDKPGAGICT
jgi:predicted nucleotidyltransferase